MVSKLPFVAVLLACGIASAVLLEHLFATAVLLSITPVFAVAYTAEVRGIKHFSVRLVMSSIPQFLAAAAVSPSHATTTLLSLPIAVSLSALICSTSLALRRIIKREVSVFLSLLLCAVLLSSVFLVPYLPFKSYDLIQVGVDINPYSAFFYGAAEYDWFHSEKMYDRIGSYYPCRLPTVTRTTLYYTTATAVLIGLYMLSVFKKNRGCH